jgi:hypothetical protein
MMTKEGQSYDREFKQNSKPVFLGLSMSDPNIRRWLSWTNQAYTTELSVKTKGKAMSLPHLWIRTKSSTNSIQEFMDVSLGHMGVKIGLINNWGEVEEILKNYVIYCSNGEHGSIITRRIHA